MSAHAKQHRYSAHGTTQFHAQYTITYYRLRPVVPDAPKQHPASLPPDPYTRIHVPRQSPSPEPEKPTPRPRRHSNVHEEALKAKHRHVHWADEHTFIDPETPSPPIHETHPATPAPQPKPAVLVKPRRPVFVSATPAPPAPPAPATPALPALHPLLVSFPARIWDMRRRASPTFHPYEPRYWEPVFPSPSPSSLYSTPRSMKLVFTPCARTELSWFATVLPSGSGRGTHLVVEDVLRAVSMELFRRGPRQHERHGQRPGQRRGETQGQGRGEEQGQGQGGCRELYADHPCFAQAQFARQLRTREGWSQRAYYEDGVRNVDLYHVEDDRGQGGGAGALWFRGLSPERLRDGEVVYRVRFSYS